MISTSDTTTLPIHQPILSPLSQETDDEKTDKKKNIPISYKISSSSSSSSSPIELVLLSPAWQSRLLLGCSLSDMSRFNSVVSRCDNMSQNMNTKQGHVQDVLDIQKTLSITQTKSTPISSISSSLKYS